mgnify:CR=1 FL=1
MKIKTEALPPVSWDDRIPRRVWISEYTFVGSLPSFLSKYFFLSDS